MVQTSSKVGTEPVLLIENGTKEEKREILKFVTGELFLKDKKVYIERKPRPKKFN